MSSHEVIKHSAIIHVSNTLTRTQRMVSNVLLKNAYSDLNSKEVHTISISNLAKAVGFKSQDTTDLKAALTALNRTQLEWNIFGKDNANSWGVTTLLADVEIIKGKGICEYSYSNKMREKLSNPNIYARLNLLVQREFRNKHALAIWELLIELLCSNKFKKGWTQWISIDSFRKFLGVQNDPLYEQFKYVNQRLIKAPLKEINEVSDIGAEVEYKREKRRVVEIRFNVWRKDSWRKEGYQLPLDLDIRSPIQVDKEEADSEALIKRIISFGISESKAEDILKEKDRSFIVENLEIVERDCEAGNVRNVSAYTLFALKEDFRPKKTFLDKDQEEKQQKQISKQRKEQLKEQQQEFDQIRLNDVLNGLSEKERKKLEDVFIKQIEDGEEGNFIIKLYTSGGLDNIAVKGSFLSFARKKLLNNPPTLSEFKKFLKKRKFKLSQYRKELEGLDLES